MPLGRLAVPILVLVLALGSVRPVRAQDAQAQDPATAQSADYRFPSGSGLLVFYVRPDRAAEFEEVVARMREILDTTDDPALGEQARSWRIFRSLEQARDQAIYLFFFDPAVPEADYDPVKVLGAGPPGEVHTLFEQLTAAVIRVERMGLERMR